ncbi:MAG: hypothetical protein DHS20C19_18870 [Acidimicrobiales bacterium]|nr:MAG: hypothetical protein DHS20C19_18870 [Acidimicrobiales bacterium]
MRQHLDQQNTGSVYLDRPIRQPDRRPTKRRRLSRDFVASLCIFVGLVSLGLAVVVAGLQSFVFDSDPLVSAFEDTLDDPAARAELEREVAAGIEQGLVGQDLTAIAAVYGLDVIAEANRISLTVLDDPTVRTELLTLVEDAHGRVLVESTDADLDLQPISLAVLDVVERESPRLASIIPPDATLWMVDSSAFPDFSWIAALAGRVQSSLLLGCLLLPLGVAFHPHRHRAAAWIGRSLLIGGLVGALIAVGIPYVAGSISGYSAVEIGVRSMTLRLLAPAAIAGMIGMGLVSLAAVLRHREEARIANEGAAAAFGYDEPPMWRQPAKPTLDLAQRGLVDVNHPLTNI